MGILLRLLAGLVILLSLLLAGPLGMLATEELIPAIEAAVAAYPAPQAYRAWPSNTFTAWAWRP